MTKTNLAIEMKNIEKTYGTFHALKHVNLELEAGKKLVVCGPSGSGKSTLIRCINGLETFDTGEVMIWGEKLESKKLQKFRSEMGMVFQQFNLFPHLTVLENLTLAPIWVKKVPQAEAEKQAKDMLERVKMIDHAHKYPAQLSGGQQQRVAIARALCMNPKIMLFDEPTSALDPEMIKEVLDVMLELAVSGMTMICVTNEMGFARQAADRIIFMDAGEVIEEATPKEFFTKPKTERAQLFLSQILHQA